MQKIVEFFGNGFYALITGLGVVGMLVYAMNYVISYLNAGNL